MANKIVREIIHAKGIEIGIYTKDFENEYISLTDIAKYRNDNDPRFVIQNWMRNRNTVEFLAVWEELHNPDFNRVQFEAVRSEAGLNRFVMTPTKWIEQTNAIGIVSKAGRYGGGTYAHSDIAMAFATWISPEFQLYIMKDYRRLKQDENSRLSLDWNLNRALSKVNYRIHTDAVKENLIPPELTPEQIAYTYASEADLLMTTVAHSKEEYAQYIEEITDVMSYLGIDTSKDFTVNGMKYSKNKDGWYESEANSEAQMAYEQLKANNRTYQFADEKTKKQIAYISDYYLQTVPESVKAAWQETLEETGVNPFQTDLSSTLTQLSVEQDFLTGGNDNIFGETKESCLAAINKILERIENPLATMTEERTA
jgi:hypothetical protein